MGGHVHAPGEVARRHDHLDGSTGEQLLHDLLLQVAQTLVEVSHTVYKRLLQGLRKHTAQFY